MDNELAPNDPYRSMDSAEDEVRPEFLKQEKGGKTAAQTGKQVASKAALKAAEKVAGVPLASKAGGGMLGAKETEEKGAGLYTGGGGGKSKKKSFMKSKAAKFSVAAIVIMLLITVTISSITSNLPSFLIRHIDLNLQGSLGYTPTEEILIKQGEYITQEALQKGKVPKAYADDLAMHGIEVGQVTLAGDFVRTNVYLADLDDKDIASSDDGYQTNSEGGELAVRFDDQIIKASEFVAAIESNPKMFAEYSEAFDITAKYYYSDEVEAVYEDMDINRGAFNTFESTGDVDEDWENFNEQLADFLDDDSSVSASGYAESGEEGGDEEESESDDAGDKSFMVQINGNEPSQIVNNVGTNTKGDHATAKASQLLNAAISSSEPYKAAKAFIAVEAPIQQAVIDGSGPANEVMRALDEENEVSYESVLNGDIITQEESILTTDNFVATVSGGAFNRNEATNFSRDRVIVATGLGSSVIDESTVATNGQEKSNVGIKNGLINSADLNTLSKATNSVSIAFSEKNSDLFKSVVGGNRIIEGGSFLSNSINSRVIGAMPSDAETIAEYHREVNEVLARRAEAERATKSPFDITSKYTFLGSIVHSFASSVITNRKSISDGFSTSSALGTIANMTDKSMSGLLGSAKADGTSDVYTETFCINCSTVNSAANSEGDIYGTALTTISTKFMRNTLEDWKSSSIGDELTDSGGIKEEGADGKVTGLKDFIDNGMERIATVGVMSSEVCEKWKINHDKDGVLQRVMDAISNAAGLYESCNGVDLEAATGALYTFSNSNSHKGIVEERAGYVLYDTVKSYIEGSTSHVAQYKEKYYKEHPVDNSREGRLARISGLTKSEARIALNYADYLTRIAKYNPKLRFAFGKSRIKEPKQIKFVHDEKIEQSIYLAWFGKIEYSDVRNQNFVV